MAKIIQETKRYYAKLDEASLDKRDLILLQYKKIENVIKHKLLGYCVRVYEHELDKIRSTNQIVLTVWPDGDSYTCLETYKITNIYMDTQILEEI